MDKMHQGLFLCLLSLIWILSGCAGVGRPENMPTSPEPIVVERGVTVAAAEDLPEVRDEETETEAELQTEELPLELPQEGAPRREPVKVKGIYISAYVAGTTSMMDELIAKMDETECNTVVIDIKDDYGRIVCEMDSAMIQEIGSIKKYIPQVQELTQKLHEHEIYVIGRLPAFRDAWLGEVRPDWCVKLADGTVFRDRDGNSWINPYREEAWDYLVEIGRQAKKLGFDEIQFDYVRFCTEKGMRDVVFDEGDTQGRSRTDIILECMDYLYENLKSEGLYVSADVFGAIINNDVNSDSVGQIYGELAKHLDAISPMIYPSHYGSGYYGIDHPDLSPYETITAALNDSRRELYFAGAGGEPIAEVRPWLQDFTASWLPEYREYGAEEIREQIQAVYDAGYDEWMLWDASCKYAWEGLRSPEEAEAESLGIAESRAALPETTWAEETEAAEPEPAEESEEERMEDVTENIE